MQTQTILAALSLALTLSAASAWAQPTPGYNTKIPQEIMTPDTVETRISTLKFFDGLPTNLHEAKALLRVLH